MRCFLSKRVVLISLSDSFLLTLYAKEVRVLLQNAAGKRGQIGGLNYTSEDNILIISRL